MTRDPENMSNVIPEGVYLTLVETHRHRQAYNLTPAEYVMCFCALLCPCRERLVGALCLNPLFSPSGEEIPFFWHLDCTRPLCELLANTH